MRRRWSRKRSREQEEEKRWRRRNLRRCFWFMQEAAWMWVSTFLTL